MNLLIIELSFLSQDNQIEIYLYYFFVALPLSLGRSSCQYFNCDETKKIDQNCPRQAFRLLSFISRDESLFIDFASGRQSSIGFCVDDKSFCFRLLL